MQSKNYALGFLGIILIVISLLIWVINMEFNNYAVATMVLGGILLLVYIAMNISLITKQLTGRAAVEGTNMVISIVIFLAIVVFLEMLLTRHSTRFDLTETKKYSLAPQSIQLVKGLKEPLTVQYIVDPSAAGDTERIKTLLELYHFYSDNFQYELVDSEKNPEKVEKIKPVTPRAVYVRRGDRHEKVSTVNENTLTNAIMKMVKTDQPTIYFTTGHNERSINDKEVPGIFGMKSVFEEEGFKVNELALFSEGEVPEDADIVVIVRPLTPFFEQEISALQEFLKYGGKVMAFLDPDGESGLESFFNDNYGVQFGKNYIVEDNPISQFAGGGPIAPIITSFGTHEIVEPYTKENMIPAISFQIVQSVEPKENLPSDMTVTELIKTSSQSWGESDINRLMNQGEAEPNEGQDKMGPLSMAVAVSKPAEEKVSDSTEEAETEEDEQETDENVEELEIEPETRLVIFGDSDFVKNRNFERSKDLYLNSANWLTQREDMISIRPKDDSGQPLTVNPVQARMVFYLSIIGLPACVAIFGFVICLLKRMRG